MEALLVRRLPEGKGWRYEPKWDGFRCLAYKRQSSVVLRSKSGRRLDRYFPDIVSLLAKVPARNFVLDGELLVQGPAGYSFSALQMRLHPAASRVNMIAQKQPASFVIFDILETDKGVNVMTAPLSERRRTLEDFWKRYGSRHQALKLSPQTDSAAEARKWLRTSGWDIDGIIPKRVTTCTWRANE
jgi:ATP-dependent DNA ligase